MTLRRPASFPIATAPIIAGKEFSCLLWPGPERYGPHWTIGRWNGEQWRDEAGWSFEPTHWAPLPRPPRSTMIIDHEPAAAPRGAAAADRRGTVKGSTDAIMRVSRARGRSFGILP